MKFSIIVLSLLKSAVILTLLSVSSSSTTLTRIEVASGLNSPVFVTARPGDTSRLMIVEQGGRIKLVKNGILQGTPFLDISGVVKSGSERGLLGLAFHPEYQTNGFFYVNYTRSSPVNDGATVIARYTVSGNPDLADGSSGTVILFQLQPFANHNAGMLAFSPVDSFLYIGFGDGGASNDPGHRGQDSTTLLGKMLRIDVDGGSPYAVPGDNPFVSSPGWRPEIWALGLRNPWRYSFDRDNGDLWIADVGQDAWEEIHYQASSSTGGENYGWRFREGAHCFNPSVGCEGLAVMTDPIYEYGHSFTPVRCSITGGYVYRGCAMPDMQGRYFYSDFCSGEIWSFRFNGVAVSDSVDHTDELNADSLGLSSFGEDHNGELYLVAHAIGKVFKIVPDGAPDMCIDPGCCLTRGNVNGSGDQLIDISDLTYLVAFMFGGGPAPPCTDEADVNGDSLQDISDLTFLVAYMFGGGPAPIAC